MTILISSKNHHRKIHHGCHVNPLKEALPSFFPPPTGKPEDSDSDLLMAQLLQLEFDKEYDAHLTRQEQHVNQNSKVTLSYRKFSHLHPMERDTERELYDDEEVMEEKLKEPNLKFTGMIPGMMNIKEKRNKQHLSLTVVQLFL